MQRPVPPQFGVLHWRHQNRADVLAEPVRLPDRACHWESAATGSSRQSGPGSDTLAAAAAARLAAAPCAARLPALAPAGRPPVAAPPAAPLAAAPPPPSPPPVL